MKVSPILRSLPILLALGSLHPALSRANPFLGDGIKADMQSQVESKAGRWLGFDQQLVGTAVRDRESPAAPVLFLTTLDGDGKRLPRPGPVVSSAELAYTESRFKIVGTTGSPPKADPRATYEIHFPNPQPWAGIHRYGGDHVVTRFWSPRRELLHEFEGEGFVAWVANPAETNLWVQRIEITRATDAGGVTGYSDDLLFGQSAFKPSWAAKRAPIGKASTRHRLRLDPGVPPPTGTNSVLTAEPDTDRTGSDAPSLQEVLLQPK